MRIYEFINCTLDEAEITHGNFSRQSPYKKQDIDIPMYDPKLNRTWNAIHSGDNPQEAFARFELEPAGPTATHIIGITQTGKRVRIATGTRPVADALVDAYNRGGFSKQSISKVPLSTLITTPKKPKAKRPDLHIVKESAKNITKDR